MSSEHDKMATGVTQVLKGHGISLIILLFFAILVSFPSKMSGITAAIPIVLILWIGWVFLLQLVYVIPLLMAAKMKNRNETLKGILTASGVTFLLSGITCGVSLLIMF